MIDQTDWLKTPSLVLPAYTYADAGRYANIRPQTVSRWYKGYSAPGHAMKPVMMAPSRHSGLSYLQLAEVAFVAQMRRKGLQLDAIRRAYWYVNDQLDASYPFLVEGYRSDGTDLFLEALSTDTHVANVSKGGQMAWRAAMERYFADFDFVDHLALRWHPYGRSFRVVIDPFMAFGRPTVEGTGIPTHTVFAKREAGETLDDIQYDFRLTREQIDTALLFEDRSQPAA